MSRPYIAGFGEDFKGCQKLQKGIIEADQAALAFDDGGGHVVKDQFFGAAAEKAKCIQQALMQAFLLLRGVAP
jgi:hypothetical protein